MMSRPGDGAAGQDRQRKIYGRRKGRPLRANRRRLVDTLLPGIELSSSAGDGRIDPSGRFTDPDRPLWVEIGYGAGEHLAWQATNNPDVNFIGSEIFMNGIARLLSDIDREALSNIRLWTDDARLLLSRLPDASVDRLFVLFPDPWPKARHHKRRIIGPSTLPDIARVLRPGGVFRAATDIADYQRWMLQYVLASGAFDWTARRPDDWRARPADWPGTRYEAKAVAAGRRCAYFSFLRNQERAT